MDSRLIFRHHYQFSTGRRSAVDEVHYWICHRLIEEAIQENPYRNTPRFAGSSFGNNFVERAAKKNL